MADPEEAAEAYRERTLAPIKDFLSEADLASVTEQLSGSCTTEIASFNEFTDLLADEAATAEYDHVVFDTAPTGHTIRLLKLPGEWTKFLDDGMGDASCLGPMSGLEKTRGTYAGALKALGDPERTRLGLVVRPQQGALAEAARTAAELGEAGVRATHLVANGVLPEGADVDEFTHAIREREQALLADLPPDLAELQLSTIALRPVNMVGIEALRALAQDASVAASSEELPDPVAQALPTLDTLVDELARSDHGLVMCMGKGGVGKTSIAAALALALVERGKQVSLTTTDPAAHLTQALGAEVEGLDVSAIDPEQAVADYRERVMATKGKDLDEAGRANLAEDLRSPCTEEVAVFQAFSKAVQEAGRRFVIMDTAPTGHTLLLMDATGSYHREIARNMAEGAKFTTPLMRLQDPEHTKVVIVTLPETTPVLEAAGLQEDLERADITPWAWVVNQSLAGVATSSPLLRRRAEAEAQPVEQVRDLASRVAGVAMRPQPPVGVEPLRELLEG